MITDGLILVVFRYFMKNYCFLLLQLFHDDLSDKDICTKGDLDV